MGGAFSFIAWFCVYPFHCRVYCEHHNQKVLIESFHLSGHTFRFRWTVQDLEVFLVSSNLPLAVKRLNNRDALTPLNYTVTGEILFYKVLCIKYKVLEFVLIFLLIN